MKPILTPRRAMAGARVATRLRQHRQHVMLEAHGVIQFQRRHRRGIRRPRTPQPAQQPGPRPENARLHFATSPFSLRLVDPQDPAKARVLDDLLPLLLKGKLAEQILVLAPRGSPDRS